MHTRFEALWVSNRESAAEASEKIEAEVKRLEAVFNRFDAGSEVAALNRSREKVKVSGEDLWFLLELCEQFRKATMGYFDIAAAHEEFSRQYPPEPSFTLYHSRHEIKLSKGCVLDFGGIAKGYALERVRRILCEEYGVENALLNFGGSSIIGIGHHPLGPAWLISPDGAGPVWGVASGRDPSVGSSLRSPHHSASLHGPPASVPRVARPSGRGPSAATEQDGIEFHLRDSSLSVSGRSRDGRYHIINPHTGRAEVREGDVAVQGKSAIVCEVLSTALYAAEPEVRNEIIANFDGYCYCGLSAGHPIKGQSADTVQ